MDSTRQVDGDTAGLLREQLERELDELRPTSDLVDVVARRVSRRRAIRKTAISGAIAGVAVAAAATGVSLTNTGRGDGTSAAHSPNVTLAGYTFYLPRGFRQGSPPSNSATQAATARQAVSTTADGATVTWGVRPWNPADVATGTSEQLDQGPLAGDPAWIVHNASEVTLVIRLAAPDGREIVLVGDRVPAATLLAMANNASATTSGR